MPKIAVGILQHPVTTKWQPWLYVEDTNETTLTCLSSHRSKGQAHLVAHMLIGAYRSRVALDLKPMLDQSAESDVPDPLPQHTLDVLIAHIEAHDNAIGEFIGDW